MKNFRNNFVQKDIMQYCIKHSSQLSTLLSALDEDTSRNIHGSHMLSGHLVSKFLQLLIYLQNPKLCVDIGSYTGFSAFTMAESTDAAATIYTIDRHGQIGNKLLRDYILNNECGQKIKILEGDALKIINRLPDKIDFVFIDADKKRTQVYFDLILNKLSKKGIVVVDDILWYGEVVAPSSERAKALDNFNKYINTKDNLENIILPIRHGLQIIYKR